jgi:hypothetical protein
MTGLLRSLIKPLVLAKLLVLMLVLTLAAVVPLENPARAQSTKPQRNSLRLVNQTPVVAPDGVFNLAVDYTYAASDPSSANTEAEVAIAVYQRVTDREALLDSIGGVRLGSPISLRTQTLEPKTSPSGRQRISVKLEIGSCSACIPVTTDGVYPVSVDIRNRNDGTVTTRLISQIIVQRNGLDQATKNLLRVALLIPMTGDRTLQPDGTRQTTPLTQIVAASESLASQRDIPLSVTLTPSLIDAARSDVSIDGTLDTLGSGLAGREIVAPTYEAIHARLQHDGRMGEILGGQWRQGSAALRDRFGDLVIDDTWIVGPDDELPDRDGLIKISPQRLLVHSPLVATSSANASASESRPNRKTPLIDSPVVFDTGLVFSKDTATGRLSREETIEESSSISAVVTDSTLTDHLRTDDPILGVSNLLADLTIAAATAAPDSGLAVSIPNQAVRREVLDQLLTGLKANHSLRPATVSELFSLPIPTTAGGGLRSVGRIVRPEQKPLSDAYLTELDGTRRRIDGAGVMVIKQPDKPEASLADRLFSAALADPDAGTAAHNTTDAEVVGRAFLVAARRTNQATLDAVRLGPGGPFRLTALRGPIVIRVDNTTGGPVAVHLSVEKGRVRLTDSTAEQDLVVDQPSQVVKLDVETRSSGSFDMRVTLTTPNGVSLSRNAYTIQSTGVSGVGVTLTLALLGLLIIWWLRTRSQTKSGAGSHTKSTPT